MIPFHEGHLVSILQLQIIRYVFIFLQAHRVIDNFNSNANH